LEEITEDDERALELFMSTEPTKQATLYDIIKVKLAENSTLQAVPDEEHLFSNLDPKVVTVYRGVGKLLSKYTSGKLPRAFKILPSLSNWEQLVYLTTPENWSSHAMRAATRMFASNLNARMAQRFYNLILLPAVCEDIKFNKRLNFHLYLALRKALYKPAAFYKGILLPVCESGKATLREATIIGSVLAKVSIPVLHSSAAILKIAEMDYSGVNSTFLDILLNKKYALPYRVVDSLVKHFVSFANDKRKLPIGWHKALLTFSQRYKSDLLLEQKEALKTLLRHQYHPHFSESSKNELQNSKCRGEKETEDMELM